VINCGTKKIIKKFNACKVTCEADQSWCVVLCGVNEPYNAGRALCSQIMEHSQQVPNNIGRNQTIVFE
jgi:hypothetical protein